MALISLPLCIILAFHNKSCLLFWANFALMSLFRLYRFFVMILVHEGPRMKNEMKSCGEKSTPQMHKWLPEVNKQKFTHPQATRRGSDRRGSGRGRVYSLL